MGMNFYLGTAARPERRYKTKTAGRSCDLPAACLHTGFFKPSNRCRKADDLSGRDGTCTWTSYPCTSRTSSWWRYASYQLSSFCDFSLPRCSAWDGGIITPSKPNVNPYFSFLRFRQKTYGTGMRFRKILPERKTKAAHAAFVLFRNFRMNSTAITAHSASDTSGAYHIAVPPTAKASRNSAPA